MKKKEINLKIKKNILNSEINHNFILLPTKPKDKKTQAVLKTTFKQSVLAKITDIKKAKFPVLYKKLNEKEINTFIKKPFILLNLKKNGFNTFTTLNLFKIENTTIISNVSIIKLSFFNVFLILTNLKRKD